MKTLYLECYSGISGDMTVGALLDLGARREVLEKALESLEVGGYHLHFGRKQKCGIDAYDFDVHLEEKHDMGHDHDYDHGDHHHDHGHVHVQTHGHDCNHTHNHTHRNIHDIYAVIDRLSSPEQVKKLASRMFHIVAEAESKAHGIPVEEVHFHEVGAVDSIVDIISVAVCLHDLGIEKVIVSPLAEGRGYVRCQHGVMPVPVPATANIASAHNLSLKLTDNEGEMVTPTGAAIAAALNSGENLPENYIIKKIGIGAGNKDFKNANILRAMLIEPKEASEEKSSFMWQLETNLDDCTGEMLGFVMELLLEAGAADVWHTPIYMKKNRPAVLLSVLCRKEQIGQMEDLIFTHTTTIGIRKIQMERTILPRRIEKVMTRYGEAEVKICTYKGKECCYPEYESVRRLCRENQTDYQSLCCEIIESFTNQ